MRPRIIFASVAIAALTSSSAFAAANPEISSLPAFSISSDVLTLDADAVWANGDANPWTTGPVTQAFACPNAIATNSSSLGVANTPGQILQVQSCKGLFDDSAGLTPFDGGNLKEAYIDNGGGTVAFTERAASNSNITLVTYIENSLSQIVFGYTATQEYDYVADPPTVDSQPVLEVIAGIATLYGASWSDPMLSPYQELFACPGGIQAQTVPTTYLPLINDAGCLRMSSSNSDLVTPSSWNLNAAYVYTGSAYVAYNSSTHGSNFVLASYVDQGAETYIVWTRSVPISGGSSSAPSNDNNNDQAEEATADVVRAAPYTGPVFTSPAISGAPAGGKVMLSGSNLDGISAIEIGGLAAAVTVNSDGEIEITVPEGLAAGTYDLVITSDSGKLTIQDGITVAGSIAPSGSAAPSTKRLVDGTAKVWVFDVAGAGKVQIFLNGQEIAWVRTDDPNDAKLKDGYLVRTVDLEPGKNVIEIFVDGERVRRTAYSN